MSGWPYVPKKGDLIRVALHGRVAILDDHDGCFKLQTEGGDGYNHYIFNEDPNAVIMLQSQSVPPAQDDVWRFGSQIWHADANTNLVRVSKTANGRLAYVRSFSTVLHSTTAEPELLFRYRV